MEELVKLLVSTFRSDPSAPSLVVSWIEQKQQWYISAVRYRQRMGEGKQKLCGATCDTLAECVESVDKQLRKLISDCMPISEEVQSGREGAD